MRRRSARAVTTSSGDSIRRLWPRLTYHYGITPEVLARTPNAIIRIYAEALGSILAEQQLGAIEAAAYPHLEKGDQKSLTRRLTRMVGVDQVEKLRDPADALGTLPAMGIGVIIEDKPEAVTN